MDLILPLSAFVIICATLTLVYLQNRSLSKTNQTLSLLLSKNLEGSSTKQADLIDKLVTLVGTKDPLAYQQVASMNVVSTDDVPYDPSDEG